VPAGRDVADPQIGYDRDARPLGDPGGLTELERAQRPSPLDPVEDGLAVGADEVDRTAAGDRRRGDLGERLARSCVQPADVANRAGRGRVRGR
jgi:hypothetical protein